MPSRKQPVAQEPCRSVHLELTDAEAYNNLKNLASWCSAVACRLKKKRKKRRQRSFTRMDKWLLCSMADNDSFEWIDVLTCDVLAGDGSVQRSQLAHVARSTASWRVPKR